MQAVLASELRVHHFDETVKSLLHQKSPTIWSIAPDASVYDAIALMSAKHIGALIVLDAGRMSGIITERDYARKVILKGKQSRDTYVREIMSTPALSVTPEQTVDECMRLMTSRRIRHLPVIEQGMLVGMLSIGDLVNWIIVSQEHTIHHLQSYISGSYPA
jgi:signal-transduction protein with cAMP-binding, CBS, and nucleotidyltransferase domain